MAQLNSNYKNMSFMMNEKELIITLQKGKINNTYDFNDFNEHQISLSISSN